MFGKKCGKPDSDTCKLSCKQCMREGHVVCDALNDVGGFHRDVMSEKE